MAEAQLESRFRNPLESAPRDFHVNQEVHDLLAHSDQAGNTRSTVEPGEIDFSTSQLEGVDKPLRSEGDVLALSPDLPPAEIPQTPENRMRELLEGLGNNPSPESLATAEGPILDALKDQIDATTQADEQFQSFDGVADLIQVEPSFDNVLKLFSSETQTDGPFLQNMQLLPHYVFTGQSEKAAETLIKLLDGQTPEGRGALQSYFDTLNRLARENPRIAQEYSTLFQTFQDAYATQERMVRDLDNSPAGTYILNK
jgi:hypothetical protein